MSKVLNLRKSASTTTSTTTAASTTTTTSAMKVMPSSKPGSTEAGVAVSMEPTTNGHPYDGSGDAPRNSIDFDDFTSSSSILEFLAKEQECCSEEDAESIFQEVSRLADNSDTRSVDEILREAELLIQKQSFLGGVGVAKSQVLAKSNGSNSIVSYTKPKNTIKMNAKYTKKIENIRTASAKVFDAAARPSPAPPAPRTGSTEDGGVSRSQSQGSFASMTPLQTPNSISGGDGGSHFTAFVDNLPSESVLSEESTPKDLETFTATERHLQDDDTDDGTDTMEEITEAIETIELVVNEGPCSMVGSNGKNVDATSMGGSATIFTSSSSSVSISSLAPAGRSQSAKLTFTHATGRRPPYPHPPPLSRSESPLAQLASPMRRPPLNFNATQACSSPVELPPRCASASATARRGSVQTPDSGIGSQTQSTQTPRDNYDAAAFSTAAPACAAKSYCDKSTNSSPKHMVSSVTSPIESMSAITREHALKQDIELLQEKLKDTEERLQSLRIQHDSLSQLHRDLRESNTHLQEESEMLKLDVQHLTECANVLRSELQSSRHDRNEALELQKALQAELDESRQEKKRTQEQREKDTKVIQDLQRQCREMERILMRKHPDSVSALIVASKNPGKMANNDQENFNSRRLLEQRIAQLESDAKEQDAKAQKILANVQARFNSVQSKYETHIADLETQVLSLQEINTKLNEKIESQVRTLDYFVTKKAEKYYNNCTQTDDICVVVEEPVNPTPVDAAAEPKPRNSAATQTAKASTRDHSTNTIASTTTNSTSHPHSASSSTSSTANSTPNNSRPNSKQSGLRKPIATASGSLTSALASKLPVSQSDSTISLSSYHAAAKEDAHLLATIRGMRVDLAIKDKAMQRLSRELDECKKTIRKLQKDASKSDKLHCGPSSASTSRRSHDAAYYTPHDQTPANTESQALKEAQNKIKLLEADYKSLHDKRLQDLKTLQSAHERELSSCHETVRILQQRLNERDEAFAMQKRRKVPVDYYALKAKVSSLERRHSEREERLHMLVDALSKGRLNGALGDLLSDNNNQ